MAALEALEKASGLTITEVLSGGDEKLTYRATAFLELYRRAPRDHLEPGGELDAGDLWERARLVEIILEEPAGGAPNPLSDGSSTTSPLSAGTGA